MVDRSEAELNPESVMLWAALCYDEQGNGGVLQLSTEIPKEDPPRTTFVCQHVLYGLYTRRVMRPTNGRKEPQGVFWNSSTGVELVLQGDDFLFVGEEQALTSSIIGRDDTDRKEGTYLGRTIRWKEWTRSWRATRSMLRNC